MKKSEIMSNYKLKGEIFLGAEDDSFSPWQSRSKNF